MIGMSKPRALLLGIKTIALPASILSTQHAQAQLAKVVGIGASACVRFNEEIVRNPNAERDYFAWAQGFMSGILIVGPKGVDEGLDLSPPSFTLNQQAAFLRSFCSSKPNQSFADGVLDALPSTAETWEKHLTCRL